VPFASVTVYVKRTTTTVTTARLLGIIAWEEELVGEKAAGDGKK
jgi:hypothetical protein